MRDVWRTKKKSKRAIYHQTCGPTRCRESRLLNQGRGIAGDSSGCHLTFGSTDISPDLVWANAQGERHASKMHGIRPVDSGSIKRDTLRHFGLSHRAFTPKTRLLRCSIALHTQPRTSVGMLTMVATIFAESFFRPEASRWCLTSSVLFLPIFHPQLPQLWYG